MVTKAYLAKKDLASALASSQRAVELDPADANAQLQRGQVLIIDGQALQAAHHFYLAGLLVPESEAPWIMHGRAMISLGRYDDAIYNFKEALLRNPYQPQALLELGRTYALIGKLDAAIHSLQLYLGVGVRDPDASKLLARLEAHAKMQRALRVSP